MNLLVIVNTILALLGSVTSSFFSSYLLWGKFFDSKHALFYSVSGAIVMSSVAATRIPPYLAIALGCISSILCVLIESLSSSINAGVRRKNKVTKTTRPWYFSLLRYAKLRDVRGSFLLHFVGGNVGAFISILWIADEGEEGAHLGHVWLFTYSISLFLSFLLALLLRRFVSIQNDYSDISSFILFVESEEYKTLEEYSEEEK